VDGERVVVLGRPALASGWDAVPRYPTVPAALDVLEELATADVDGWLRDWAGAAPQRGAAPLELQRTA
jgi:hypothetical protein